MGENLGICFTKALTSDYFAHSLISDKMTERGYLSSKTSEATYIAPLYRYDEIMGDKEGEVSKIEKIPNFTPEFSEFKAKSKVLKDKTSEQILAFIYANLYNLTYRKNFLEYLKIGFPRVNFEVSEKEFEGFEKTGQRLIDLHLLKCVPKDESIKLEFSQEANKANPSFVLEKLSEKARFVNGKIILNKHLQIAGIDENVWGYTVGGYQVLKQWLKYRVNKALSKDEFEHLVNICKIIKQSLILQNELERLSENLSRL